MRRRMVNPGRKYAKRVAIAAHTTLVNDGSSDNWSLQPTSWGEIWQKN